MTSWTLTKAERELLKECARQDIEDGHPPATLVGVRRIAGEVIGLAMTPSRIGETYTLGELAERDDDGGGA